MIDLDLQKKSIELWREDAWELHGKLRAAENRIEQLEAALREIAGLNLNDQAALAIYTARAALEGKKDE